MKKQETTTARPSFPFFASFYDAISTLPDGLRLPLYESICRFAIFGTEPDFGRDNESRILTAIWITMRPVLAKSRQLYLNGLSGGAPTGNRNAAKQPKFNQNSTKKQADKEEDKEEDREEDRIGELFPAAGAAPRPRRKPSFSAPTIDEVRDFFRANGLKGSADEFFYCYESSGWKKNNGAAIKSWQAAAHQWSIRESKFSSGKSQDAARRIEIPSDDSKYQGTI